MKEWSDLDEVLVLFTENYWQENTTLMIHSSRIVMQHAHVADAGIILDKASTHYSDEVKEHVEKTNSDVPPRIDLTFVDAGLTSIQSPSDVTIIKPLKNECRILYQGLHLAEEELKAGQIFCAKMLNKVH